jgi:hypothetical protein
MRQQSFDRISEAEPGRAGHIRNPQVHEWLARPRLAGSELWINHFRHSICLLNPSMAPNFNRGSTERPGYGSTTVTLLGASGGST